MKQQSINALHGIIAELENGHPISKALSVYYIKRKVVIPVKTSVYNYPIDVLDLTTRTSNALKRTRIMTFGDLLDYIENGNQLKTIKNFGATSIMDFCEKLLDYNFDLLNSNEKVEFLITFVEENEDSLREVV